MSDKKENPWQHYQGQYIKKFYDVITIDGKQYNKCWPNAGNFHCHSLGQQIPGSAVGQVRITKEQW